MFGQATSLCDSFKMWDIRWSGDICTFQKLDVQQVNYTKSTIYIPIKKQDNHLHSGFITESRGEVILFIQR